jgi:hypothetical protein
LRRSRERVHEGYAPADMRVLLAAVQSPVPKPFLVQNQPKTESKTATRTARVADSGSQRAATASAYATTKW